MSVVTPLKPWPVVAGILVDLAGSTAFLVHYVVLMLGWQAIRGVPPGEDLGTGSLIVSLIVGLLLTLLGGFVAGRMAKTREVPHGTAVGIGSLLVGLIVHWTGGSDGTPAWHAAIGFIAVVPAGALGGYLAGKWANRSMQPASDAAT